MNNEIKEILDILKTDMIHIRLFKEDREKLLDYITNLQEEVKSANESITWWNNRYNALQEENKELKEDKKKAIEILKYDMENIDLEDGYSTCEQVLNVLEGSDKE